MKFGYDRDGKLVPVEELELAEKLAELKAELDKQDPASRREDADRLRRLLVAAGQVLSGDDENLLTLYADGIVDYHNVEHYFGQRLVSALQLWYGQRGTA
jgi:hypothetical protein